MAIGDVAQAQELARQSISELMLEALEPGSTIFTDFVSHLCHAFRALATSSPAAGPAAQLQGRLYDEIAGCAAAVRLERRSAGGDVASDASVARRRLSAEALREFCEGAVALLSSPDAPG